MGTFSVLLLVALIVVYIFIKRDDKRNWETVYEAPSGSKAVDVQQRYIYLKRNRIHCHQKTVSLKVGSIRSTPHASMQTITRIEVHQKDADRARRLLAEFQQR
ncbi:hypothetical protein KBTX_04200 [wastewater metagenome]|uniref:Uncharacterized protein n=2 Tax=unclassified sequences TaxID=12908 RepID=A0A5B8RKP5_9ZZZZ|nr:hypothetical protein KBTEX_04200 [uncultured organism]